ncbi:hypothetical protein VPHK479_0004 [Vibrio phage K479]
MNWKSISNLVGQAAPLLGGLLGGPVGAGAGALVAQVLGTEPTPQAIKQKLDADPEAYLKLKTAELDHEKELTRLQLEEMRVILEDKQHARTAHQGSKVPSILTLIVFVLILLAGTALVFATIPTENKDMVNMLVGALIGFASSVTAFWFGADEQKRRGQKR